jgi:hypothetical protein
MLSQNNALLCFKTFFLGSIQCTVAVRQSALLKISKNERQCVGSALKGFHSIYLLFFSWLLHQLLPRNRFYFIGIFRPTDHEEDILPLFLWSLIFLILWVLDWFVGYHWAERPLYRAREFVFESGVGELAAKLMQSSYSVFYYEHVLNKEPGNSQLCRLCFIMRIAPEVLDYSLLTLSLQKRIVISFF